MAVALVAPAGAGGPDDLPRLFAGWSVESDELLVRYVDAQLQQGSGSVLSLRPAQLAKMEGDDAALKGL